MILVFEPCKFMEKTKKMSCKRIRTNFDQISEQPCLL